MVRIFHHIERGSGSIVFNSCVKWGLYACLVMQGWAHGTLTSSLLHCDCGCRSPVCFHMWSPSVWKMGMLLLWRCSQSSVSSWTWSHGVYEYRLLLGMKQAIENNMWKQHLASCHKLVSIMLLFTICLFWKMKPCRCFERKFQFKLHMIDCINKWLDAKERVTNKHFY